MIKKKTIELQEVRDKIHIILDKLKTIPHDDIKDIILEKKSQDKIKNKDDKLFNEIEDFELDIDNELKKIKPMTMYKSLARPQQIIKKERTYSDKLLSIIKKKKSINIKDRINYYFILHSYINNLKKNKNCFKIYRDNSKISYRIGNKIILDKKIGDESKYGITFISYYKSSSKKILKEELIFATKLTDFTRKGNITEYEILKYLTNLNINNICPHFPIGYGYLTCRQNEDTSIASISGIKEKKINILGSNLYNTDHIFIFNELANGSLKSFKNSFTVDFILNALEQCFIAIMFFNKYVNAYHNDCHFGNFLYHKIEPGGFIHYNIYGTDYYIENIGYLWVIWDYGLISPYYNSKKINNNKFGISEKTLPIITDFNKFIKNFIYLTETKNTTIGRTIYNLLQIYIDITDISKIKELSIKILEILVSSANLKKSINSKIINKKPYIIN